MTRLEKICPNCGSHLILKGGQFGEFLACPRFPECRYTEPVHLHQVLKDYVPPSPYCDKCNHTGLLPFIKHGKVIPNTFVDCECKISIPEHFDPIRLRPDDFDFPCSDTFRAHSFEYCGQQDPDFERPLPIPQPEPVRSEPQWTRQQWDYVQNLRAMVSHTQNKLVEHIEASKQRKRGDY